MASHTSDKTARHRIFKASAAPWNAGDIIQLPEEEAHHLLKVLRAKNSEIIELANPKLALLFEAKIIFAKPSIQLEIVKEKSVLQKNYHSKLIFALCKATRNELAIEKATELGVDEIILFESERSVAKLSENKLERLKRITHSAAAQSKRVTLPRLRHADDLENLKRLISDDAEDSACTKIICSLEKKRQNLSELIGENKNYLIAVGPEGDFTETEYRFFEELNFMPIGLSHKVLRSETAALSILAAIEVMEFDEDPSKLN